MKEMIYSPKREREILVHDVFDGVEFYIVSLGSHPCAYVRVPEKCRQIVESEIEHFDLNCHGGITYVGDGNLPWGKFPGFWIGWDYAHAGDYTALPEGYPEDDGHKWTTTEILNEIKEFVTEMLALCGREEK